MICITYGGLVGWYLLAGAVVAWMLRREAWVFVTMVHDNGLWSPRTRFSLICLVNTIIWPLPVYICLKHSCLDE